MRFTLGLSLELLVVISPVEVSRWSRSPELLEHAWTHVFKRRIELQTFKRFELHHLLMAEKAIARSSQRMKNAACLFGSLRFGGFVCIRSAHYVRPLHWRVATGGSSDELAAYRTQGRYV